MDSRQVSVRKSKKKHHRNDDSDESSNDSSHGRVKHKKSKGRRKKRDSSSSDDSSSDENSKDYSNDKMEFAKEDKKSKRRRKKRDSSSSDDSSSDSNNLTAGWKNKKLKKRPKKRDGCSSSDSDNWVERESVPTNDGHSEKSAKKKDKKKKKKKSKKRRKERKSDDDNRVENVPVSTNVSNTEKPALKRDDWMTVSQAGMLKTYTKERKEPTKPNEKANQIDAYDPSKSKYELNPYWKSNGTGLPGFQKPKQDDESDDQEQASVRPKSSMNQGQTSSTRNWEKPSNSNSNSNVASGSSKFMKPADERDASVRPKWSQYIESESDDAPDASVLSFSNLTSNLALRSRGESKISIDKTAKTSSDSEDADLEPDPEPKYISDEQINNLAAQQLKAELKGNTEKAARLQHELADAKLLRDKYQKYMKEKAAQGKEKQKQKQKPQKDDEKEEHVLLTRTDASGNARPLMQSDATSSYSGRKGEKQSRKHKKQVKMETHDGDGQRVRYFADDDRYSLKEMFEREKLPETVDELEAQYVRMLGNLRTPMDDEEDIFTDGMRKSLSHVNRDERELQAAIRDHQKMTWTLENCDRCFQSKKFDQDLLISTGKKIYLSLPWHVGIQRGHCILSTMQHISCCTQLDEDVWEELTEFRRALTRMFGDDVIFYEIANNLHKREHFSVHCIPIPSTHGEMAPFYLKKALENSETAWSINKQLIKLDNKSLRASIPKKLPYVWVNFGMGQGFAHVIEDQDRFSATFVQEVICGMLNMEPKAWRKPLKERNPLEKVTIFNEKWQPFDITKNT